MIISALIDTEYRSIDIEKEVIEVADWFNELRYLVTIDQNMQPVGIVTIEDIHKHPSGKIIDCDIAKPKIKPDDTLIHVMEIMKKDNFHYLPVFDQHKFVGVISLTKIAQRLAEHVKNAQMNYQKVIHDVRNPITNIKGLTNTINIKNSDIKDRELLQLILVSCQHAIDTLDDLMYIEQIEAEYQSVKEVELVAFYKQCIVEQKGLALLKNIEIIEDYLPLEVTKLINEPKLKRAIHNIIANAIKFSYPFSTIKISTEKEGDKLILKISDKGVGIPVHSQPYIFNKFSSAQRLGTNGELSTGLGLYFTKQCINDHNGEITFESSERNGTQFYISL